MISVEPDSPWFNSIKTGKIRVCDDEDVAKMYKLVIKRCATNGIEQYEISAFSEPGEESLHNLKYWMNEVTLGFGPSAASYVMGLDIKIMFEQWKVSGILKVYLIVVKGFIQKCDFGVIYVTPPACTWYTSKS